MPFSFAGQKPRITRGGWYATSSQATIVRRDTSLVVSQSLALERCFWGRAPCAWVATRQLMQTSQSPASKDCASRKYSRRSAAFSREGGGPMPRQARRRKDRRPDRSTSLRVGRRVFVLGAALTIAASICTAAVAADLSADEVRALLASHAGAAAPDLSNRNLAGLDLSGIDFKGA